MRSVRTPSWSLEGLAHRVQDLLEVVSDIAAAINSEEDVHALAMTGLDPAGDTGAAGAHDHVYHEELGASQAGASWQFSQQHQSGSERVFLNNFPLRRVGSDAGVNEYTINVLAYTITLWTSKSASDFLEVDYAVATDVDHTHVVQEAVGDGLSGSSFDLDNTPTTGSDRLFLNNLPLRRVGAGTEGLNEYSISGKTITLWASKETGDHLVADYIY